MIKPRGRGVLDPPLSRGMTASGWARRRIRFSDRSSPRNETPGITHHLPGRRCHGTPPLSETHLWICCRRDSVCCKREGGTAAAGFTSGPCAAARRGRGSRCYQPGRGRSPRPGRSALGTARARARALGPPASWGLAPKALGLAPPPLGLASLAQASLAQASLGMASSLAPPSLVRRHTICLTQNGNPAAYQQERNVHEDPCCICVRHWSWPDGDISVTCDAGSSA
jgi:hypothetical protein